MAGVVRISLIIFCLVFLGTSGWCGPVDLVGEDGYITQADVLAFIQCWHSEPNDSSFGTLT